MDEASAVFDQNGITNLATDYQVVIYLLLSLFGLLILTSLIYSKSISKNDFYRIGALLAVAVQCNDIVL